MTAQPAFSTSPAFSSDALLMAASNLVGTLIAQDPQRLNEAASLMAKAYAQLRIFAAQTAMSTPSSAPRKAAIDVQDSIQPAFLVCLEDGKKLKMLKRYLKTNYNMTPEQYRARWNLPVTYPMVAPDYAKRRSQLAKDIGLGTIGKPSAITRKERMQQASLSRTKSLSAYSDAA